MPRTSLTLALATLGALALNACGAPAPGDRPAQRRQDDPRDAAVYAALRDSLRPAPGTDSILVVDSTAVVDVLATSPEYPRDDTLAVHLLERLAVESRVPRPTAGLPLPVPARTIPHAEAERLLAAQQFGGARAATIRQVPTAARIYSVSPVAYSADGRHAIVFYSYRCGGALCGHAAALWLTAGPEAGEWRVHKVVYALIT